MTRLEEEFLEDEDDDDDEENEDEDDRGSELSSSPSIPDGEIDFSFVYALHTFMATVEGQATSQKGDTLVLLDDSNSYWWLVRNIKDDSIGYLPAEHIETPSERLARLNKHRNVDNGAAQMIDVTTVVKPNLASKFGLRRTRKSTGKSVTFSSPRFIEYEVLESEDEESLAEALTLHGHGHSAETLSVENDTVTSESGKSAITTSQTSHKLTDEQPIVKDALENEPKHTDEEAEQSDTRSHEHKNSLSSFHSETNSSVATDEGDSKEGKKKKKNVFSGLFKKRSKRETSADASLAQPITSQDTDHQLQSASVEDAAHKSSDNDSTRRAQVTDLPAAVKEMRSSVLMDVDPISVDMVEAQHHRGPVDEVEMLHTGRLKGQTGSKETLDRAFRESFVWSDQAVEAYLNSETKVYHNLIVIVRQQAKSERLRQLAKVDSNIDSFQSTGRSIDRLLKDLDGLLMR